MSRQFKTCMHRALPGAGAVLAISAILLLGGCVIQERGYAPPPRVYEPPPAPQAYAEPAEGEMRAAEAPPPLPEYEQPPCPEEGYLWTPGYWGWGGAGYYWVPGTWIQPPRVGVLWTPGYWGFVGGVYLFHAGYWGPHVGFYGGINYGYGYGGEGYVGGRWSGNEFAYNRTVNNVNVTNVHNTYNETVINNVTVTKVSYNGGAGGVPKVPTAQERAAVQETHVAPTPLQRRHVQEASSNPALAAKSNGGHPAIAATPRAAAFNAPEVVRAHGAAPGGGAGPAHAPGAPVSQHPGYAGVVHPGAPPPGARPGVNQAPPPNARPGVNQAPPPNAATHPQAARPPQPQPAPHAAPPKSDKRDEGGGR